MADNTIDKLKHDSGLTPSIITTINNTNPNPQTNGNLNNNNPSLVKGRRAAEPFYESYLEDSFVGHWEREDDIEDEFNEGNQGEDQEGPGADSSALHPSTIEFDFDSFGPESFIYTPVATAKQPIDDKTRTNDKDIQNETISEDGIKAEEDSGRSIQIEMKSCETTVKSCATSPNPLDHIIDDEQIDLKVIEPYKKVISYAGCCHYYDSDSPPVNPSEPAPAVIVFSACYLPDRSRRDYNYVMDHLFLYVLKSLHELIADDYILIYLHNAYPSTSNNISISAGSTSSTHSSGEESRNSNNLPTFSWMKRCYQMIDRKLRKNLKILYLVKPTFWLKTIVIMCKPFISTKFRKKLRFVEDTNELKKSLPTDKLTLPASANNI